MPKNQKLVWFLDGFMASVVVAAGLVFLFRDCLTSVADREVSPDWKVVLTRDRLSREFIWTGKVSGPVTKGQRYRLRLTGQTRIVVLEGDAATLRLRGTTERGRN